MTNVSPMVIKHLFRSTGHNFFGHHQRAPSAHPMEECTALHCLAGRGIEGDRFCDYQVDYKGQITFFSEEVYEELRARFEVWEKPPSTFRRNVIVADVDLNALIGQEFEIQGVRFFGTGECKPCHWMDAVFAPGTESALAGRGGLRAKILTDGLLRVTP